MTIAQNIADINARIHQYENKYGRPLGSIKLIAASKKQSPEKIQAAFQAGVSAFGENYLQEALKKMGALATLPIEWHFIGRIQHNKIKKIAEHFDWVQSVADIDTAVRLNKARPMLLPPLNICIEVNISHEKTKAGIAINHVIELADTCRALKHLRLRGLMSIPAKSLDFDLNRKAFHKLQVIANVLRDHGISIDTLSMGMSSDFEAAIAEGSTMIRIGEMLFGKRV